MYNKYCFCLVVSVLDDFSDFLKIFVTEINIFKFTISYRFKLIY